MLTKKSLKRSVNRIEMIEMTEEEKRLHRCCFSGHRPEKLDEPEEQVKQWLREQIKRIKEGNAIKDSIPISLNREKHPNLATMLFIGHSAATAVNAGKVLFTKNPMAINYPQWIAFAKYSYSQLKWILIEKPELRRRYVEGVLMEELHDVIGDVNQTFRQFSDEYIVIMDAEPS